MLKLLAFVALFGGFCWFGTTVPLGPHTLFGHLRAISATKESQDLLDATRQSAKPLVDDVRRRIAGMPERDPNEASKEAPKEASKEASKQASKQAGTPVAAGPDAGAPQESVSASDRRRLRRLLTAADHAAARP
jgi:hypothetical protein